jgi:hypothetical protein
VNGFMRSTHGGRQPPAQEVPFNAQQSAQLSSTIVPMDHDHVAGRESGVLGSEHGLHGTGRDFESPGHASAHSIGQDVLTGWQVLDE